MTRIYTKTGDDGTTGLIGGKRVSKDSPCIEACGALDELNALIGVVRSQKPPGNVDQLLQQVQEDLFLIGAELATPQEKKPPQILGVGNDDIRRLERAIDEMENSLQPLKQFILPGGSIPGAHLHLARAFARRAERHCVTLFRAEKVNPRILEYLNRLSDLCFVLARYVNRTQSLPESHPSLPRRRDA